MTLTTGWNTHTHTHTGLEKLALWLEWTRTVWRTRPHDDVHQIPGPPPGPPVLQQAVPACQRESCWSQSVCVCVGFMGRWQVSPTDSNRIIISAELLVWQLQDLQSESHRNSESASPGPQTGSRRQHRTLITSSLSLMDLKHKQKHKSQRIRLIQTHSDFLSPGESSRT